MKLIQTRQLQCALDELTADRSVSAKVGVGMFVLALPILNIAALGYQVQVARRAARGRLPALPAWGEFGRLFRIGLPLAVARWLYALPGQVLLLASGLLLVGPVLARLWHSGFQPAAGLAPLPLRQLYLVAALLAGALVFTLAEAFLTLAITAQYVRHGRLAACFHFRALLGLVRGQRPGYVEVWVSRHSFDLLNRPFLKAFGLLLGLIPIFGALALFFFWRWYAFVNLLIHAHVIGQWLRESGHTARDAAR